VSLTLVLIVGLFIVCFRSQSVSNGYSTTPPMVPTPRPSPLAIASLVPVRAPVTSASHPTCMPSPLSALQLGSEILQVDFSNQVALRGSSGLDIAMEAARFPSKTSPMIYASQLVLRGPTGVAEMGAATTSQLSRISPTTNKTKHRWNYVLSFFFREVLRQILIQGKPRKRGKCRHLRKRWHWRRRGRPPRPTGEAVITLWQRSARIARWRRRGRPPRRLQHRLNGRRWASAHLVRIKRNRRRGRPPRVDICGRWSAAACSTRR
jgi:hypothetical protein